MAGFTSFWSILFFPRIVATNRSVCRLNVAFKDRRHHRGRRKCRKDRRSRVTRPFPTTLTSQLSNQTFSRHRTRRTTISSGEWEKGKCTWTFKFNVKFYFRIEEKMKNYERKFMKSNTLFSLSISFCCSKGHLVYFVLRMRSLLPSLCFAPADRLRISKCDNPSNILNSHNQHFSLLNIFYLEHESFSCFLLFLTVSWVTFVFQTKCASGFEHQW